MYGREEDLPHNLPAILAPQDPGQRLRSCTFNTKLQYGSSTNLHQATLTYGCICGDGLQPNVSEYTLSLPYFVCTEWGTQCVAACKDNYCAAACRQDHPCGAQNPTLANATTSTTAAPTASKTNEIFSGLGQTGTPGSGATPGLDLGRAYGLAAVLGSLFLGFAIIL